MLGAVGPIPAPQDGGEERSRGDAGGSPGGAGGSWGELGGTGGGGGRATPSIHNPPYEKPCNLTSCHEDGVKGTKGKRSSTKAILKPLKVETHSWSTTHLMPFKMTAGESIGNPN